MRLESEIIVNITNCFHISLTSLSISHVRYLANFIAEVLEIGCYIAWLDEYWNSRIINRKHSANIVVCKPQCVRLDGPNDMIELIMVTNNSVNAFCSSFPLGGLIQSTSIHCSSPEISLSIQGKSIVRFPKTIVSKDNFTHQRNY